MKHLGLLYWFWHWQNLKRDAVGRGLYGRAWLHLYWGHPDRRGRKLTCLGADWSFFRRQHSVGVSLDVGTGDGDRDVVFAVRIPYFGIYLSAEDVWPRRWEFYNTGQKYPSSREWSITWHNAALWIALGRDPDESWGRGGPPFWKDARSSQRHIVIHPLDILFGPTRCTTTRIADESAAVQLPEGDYPVRVVIERRIWGRPRLPWRRRERVYATVKSERGLPIPGKGENGWDCDEDAYFSIGTPETTVAGAVAHATASVLKRRQRYGGLNWRPSAATGD